MTRKILAALVLSAAVLVLCLPSSAASQIGAIKGRVVDKQGQPLSGAYLYVSSPTMLGIANFITSKTGRYGVTGLTPGRFKVLVEMPGFKTVTVENVAVNAGATATLDFKLEPSEIEDEVIGGRPGPTLDRESARWTVVLDNDLLSRLPLKRDFAAVLELVPGLVFEGDAPDARASLNGLPVTTNVFVQDGVNVTHPEDQRSMSRINVDLIDQVVVETAGHAAEAGPAQGAYVNVIHRPGGRSFQGSLAYTNASKGLAKSLWSAGEIAEMGGAALPSLQREHDFSLTLGGPVLEDISWLFANIRYRAQSRKAPFRYWTDPLGVRHFVYDLADRDMSGLFKLSMGVLNKFKGVLEFGFSGIRQPVYEEDVDRLRPEAATRRLDGEGAVLGRGGFSYNVDQSTRVDLGIGYSKYKQPLLLNDTASAKPQYYDVITGYSWGSGSMNDREEASRMRADVTITRLQDRFLGMPHELVAGGDYETVYSTSSVWKA
ncbi:MAG: TonB-dependent receptor, partial [Longimicrobiales bacterium]|nr:TonB-dependent receptor [Longimicrobiales bacterium]